MMPSRGVIHGGQGALMAELEQETGERKRRWLLRSGLVLLILVALSPPLTWFLAVLCGKNVHAVIPGRAFRGAQLSPTALEHLVKQHDIRTVINLRGCSDVTWPWYHKECLAAQRLNIDMVDLAFSAYRFPHTDQLRELIEVLDRAEYPVYLHCRRGADRTGLASAVLLLLQPGFTLKQAYWQLSIRYGHVALGRPAYLRRFLHIYGDWLKERGEEHSPELFRRWALSEYDGGWHHCRFTEFAHGPLKPDEYIPCAVTACNTGLRKWHMRPVKAAGMHFNFRVRDAGDVEVFSGHAGLLERTVARGDAVCLHFGIPPLPAGRYQLFATLEDADNYHLYQTGSEPLEVEFEVRN
jgi:hypothetical protein